jgi:hypothetical protein
MSEIIGLEKNPLHSKKFVAYLIASILWKAILIVALFVFSEQLKEATMAGWWFMVSTVIVAGFVDVGYIGGQAWLDRYVRVAHITMNGRPGGANPPKPDEQQDEEPPEDEPTGDDEEEIPPTGPNQPE